MRKFLVEKRNQLTQELERTAQKIENLRPKNAPHTS